jgi:mRNA interferase MazF
MVSSQIQHTEEGLDEIITPSDADFPATGLKVSSVIRLSRLAVLDGKLLVGSIGAISDERLSRLRQRLAKWVGEAPG